MSRKVGIYVSFDILICFDALARRMRQSCSASIKAANGTRYKGDQRGRTVDWSRELRVSDPKVEYQVVRRAYCDKVIAAGESRVCGCARCFTMSW